MLNRTTVTLDPLTLDCDVTVDGERVRWIGAKALYRFIQRQREIEHEEERKRVMRGGR